LHPRLLSGQLVKFFVLLRPYPLGPWTRDIMSIGYRSVPSTGHARQVLPVHALLPHKLSRVTSSSQQCHRGCSGQSAVDTTWTLHSEYCPARQCNSQHRRAPTDRTVTSRPYDDIQLPTHSQQLKPAAENDIQQLGLYDSSETTII